MIIFDEQSISILKSDDNIWTILDLFPWNFVCFFVFEFFFWLVIFKAA